MGSTISGKNNSISLNYDGIKSNLDMTKVIGTSNNGGYSSYSGNGTEEYAFDDVSLDLGEYSTIQLDSKTVELYLEGFLAKKSELQAKLEVASSPDEIAQLQKEIFMIDFNMYMLNNQKKLYMYQDIANSEEFMNYKSDGKVSLVHQYLIDLALNEKGTISWSDENKLMYSYLFETQGKDAANEYYDVILDVVNREKGLSKSDGMISLTNNSAELTSSFIPSASDVFNNGGVLSSRDYAEMYALIYHTKMEGTYEETINEMNQLLMSGISISIGAENKGSETVGESGVAAVLYNGEGLMNPVDFTALTSPFGTRIHPIYGGQRFHNGVDLAAPEGTPIYAPMDGIVDRSWYDSDFGGGNSVVIKHDGGYQTGYAHMAEYIVSPGDEIKKGQCIGYVGNTGASTGSHLHLVVKLDGNYVNPEEHIDLNWKPGNDGIVTANGQSSYNINGIEQLNVNVETIIPLVNLDSQGSYNIDSGIEQSNTNVDTVIPSVGSDSQISYDIDSGIEPSDASIETIPLSDSNSQDSYNINSGIEPSDASIETIPSSDSNSQDSYNINNEVEQVSGGDPITPSSSVTHTISRGDTLFNIAQKYYGDGSRYTEIAAANNISNPNMIYEGQELIIP